MMALTMVRTCACAHVNIGGGRGPDLVIRILTHTGHTGTSVNSNGVDLSFEMSRERTVSAGGAGGRNHKRAPG